MKKATFEEVQQALYDHTDRFSVSMFKSEFTSWLAQHGWTMDEFYDEGLRLYKELTGKDWVDTRKDKQYD